MKVGTIIKCKHDAEGIKKARKILSDFGIVSYEEHNYKEYIGIEFLLENESVDKLLSSKYIGDDGFIKTG